MTHVPTIRRAVLAGAFIAAAFAASAARAETTAPVRAEQPWARATAPQQKVGGAYVTLTSLADDVLVGGNSPVAGRLEIHEMHMDGTIMRMRELPDGLPLPAGQRVALTPGGLHIMLVDLKQPLVAGQTIPMQLRFRTAPPLDLQVQVAPVGARGPNGQAPAAAMPMGAMPGHTH